MNRRPFVLAFAALLAFAGASFFSAEAAPKKKKRKIAGTWNLRGWNMGKDPSKKEDYTGKVKVSAKGKNTFAVSWVIGGKTVNKGVGIYHPDVDAFAAGYSIGGSAGCAIWTFSEDGKTMTCTGTFEKKLGNVAHEEWSK